MAQGYTVYRPSKWTKLWLVGYAGKMEPVWQVLIGEEDYEGIKLDIKLLMTESQYIGSTSGKWKVKTHANPECPVEFYDENGNFVEPFRPFATGNVPRPKRRVKEKATEDEASKTPAPPSSRPGSASKQTPARTRQARTTDRTQPAKPTRAKAKPPAKESPEEVKAKTKATKKSKGTKMAKETKPAAPANLAEPKEKLINKTKGGSTCDKQAATDRVCRQTRKRNNPRT